MWYRLRYVCKALRHACCEASPGDYDSCSDDDGSVLTREDIRRPNLQKLAEAIATSQPPSAKHDAGRGGRETDGGIAVHVADHGPPMQRVLSEDSTSREGESSFIPSPGTDVISTASPATSTPGVDVVLEKNTPSPDTARGGSTPAGVATRARPSRLPPRTTAKKSRWTDDVLEGFLYSTLVDGSGLVLDKLDSDGSGKKSGERILSYDPDQMRLNWISTGLRRKTGSMLAKDIGEVTCEGTSASKLGLDRRRKVYSTSQERDAQILKELLLFVRRQAISNFAAAVSRLAAAANSPAASTTGVDSAICLVAENGGNSNLIDTAIFGNERGRGGREPAGSNVTPITGVFTKSKGRRRSVK
ncbi:unnamed protein product [Ectocarpus sp. CCAP 1310/34]|nr:unnamed protein product [Ectocarpus sp. CCAP 1310/34]